MLEIGLVKHSQEKEQLLDLFRASFGHNMPAELWDWKYVQNPVAPADSEVIVAMDKGRIVGARPFRLSQLWLGNQNVSAAQHTDTMVHPEYQGRGIFNRMGQFSMHYLKENGYALSYGFGNEKSRLGFLKQGYRLVALNETFLRPINTQRLLSYRLGNRALGEVLGFLYDKLLNVKPQRAFQPTTSFQLEVSDRFNDELKEVDALRDESLIDLVRSESYLRWLFDQRPNRDYKYIVAKKDGTLWGYAVLSMQEQNDGLVYGYIVDHLAKNRDITCFRPLINRSLYELEKLGCDIALIWALGEPVLRKELLERLGFKSSLGFPYNRFFGHGFLNVIGFGEQVDAGPDIYDKENWRVTCAYWDSI